jgi:hypothetical protein
MKDEEGKVVEVTELSEGEQLPKSEAPKKDEEPAAAAPFTPEQMDAIRKIISEELAKASGSTDPETHDSEEEEMKKKEEEAKKAAEEAKKAEEEAKKVGDSKGPVSIENKTPAAVKDSSLDLEEERNNAFAKRYGLSR